MPEMNTAPVNLGSSNQQPSLPKARMGMGVGRSILQHNLDLNYATHVGKIQAGLSAQDHNQRMKENAANNRHEIRKSILEHQQGLEKEAVVHANSVDQLRTGSELKVSEGEAAHKNAVDLMNRLGRNSAPGSEVAFKHGDVSATYTLKNSAKPKATTTPTHTGPSFVGMPGYRMSAPAAPAAATPVQEEGPKPLVKQGEKGRFASLKTAEELAAAKKAKKKSTPAKTAPTVGRNAQGRMTSLKPKD